MNSYKHGLTGAGVVQAPGEAAEAAAQAERLRPEMRPQGELEEFLVERTALQMTRLRKVAQYQAACQAERERHAVEQFDDRRHTDVETQMDWIAAEPATRARRLHETVLGVELVIATWQALHDDLHHPYGVRWDHQHIQRAANLMGRRPGDVPFTRLDALGYAVRGDFSRLRPEECEGAAEAVKARAVAELTEFILGRIARLKERLAGMNPLAVAPDREEAPLRALFDPSPEAVLVRKYEAALERSFWRTLNEFREAQAARAGDREPEINPETDEVCASLGSFFPARVSVAPRPPKGANTGPDSGVSGPPPGPDPVPGEESWPSPPRH